MIIIKKASDEAQEPDANIEWLLGGLDIENRQIEIRGEINETIASFITRSVLKLTQISKDPINIILSSPGGDVYEGLSIFDCLTSCPCEINIFGTGKIMSAAFIIYLAGDKRYASKYTTFMMHSNYFDPGENKVKDHEIQVNEGKRLNNIFLDIISDRTKRNRKYWYRTILSTDKFFSVTEALECGIINTGNIIQTKRVKNVRK